MKKRILAVVLCIIMIVCSIPLSAFAVDPNASRAIEFKDILSISLFKNDDDAVREITVLDPNDLQDGYEDYLVKVNLLNEPGFYATIRSHSTENNELSFVLDLDFDVVQYANGSAVNHVNVVYGPIANGTATVIKKSQNAQTSAGYIPELVRLSALSAYDEDHAVAYANMYKLMPFYDAKYLLTDGNAIAEDDELNTKLIKSVVPLDENGDIVTYITSDSVDKISAVRVVYTDNSASQWSVTPSGTQGFIANYNVDGKSFGYSFGRYIVNENEDLIREMLEFVSALDYTEDLDPITNAADSRLYKEEYEVKTVAAARDIILEVFAQSENYRFNMNSDVLSAKIKQELLTNGYLKNILYAYNYYSRWYSFKVGSVSAIDVLLTQSGLFKSTMTFDKIINSASVRTMTNGTNAAHNFYANVLAQYTGYAKIDLFIEYLVAMFTDYTNCSDWFADSFNGIIVEAGVDDKPQIRYRAWENMKIRDHTILPILNVPANSTYIISYPTQLLFGAQKTYITDPENAAQHEQLVRSVNNFAGYVKTFYTVASNLTDYSRWNFVNINYDHRYAYNDAGVRVLQSAGDTTNGFHKYFIEALGTWHALNGAGAYANGTDIYWVAYSALGNINVWTHESGHNQDSRIFLNGAGRRSGGGAEDYADGNTSQGTGDGGMNFNLIYYHDVSNDTTVNYTPDRINGKDEIYSFYKGMVESLDYLDYIEAQAFLKLTPKQQAAVATQIFYPNRAEDNQEIGDSTTGWRLVTEEQIAAMNLQTVEDLWDNHIMLQVGVTGTTSLGTNRYGGPGIYNRHWYQQHNDVGRPDSYALKQLAWEMLGIGGYDNGYIEYYSAKNPNDLAALRSIIRKTNPEWATVSADEYTWKQYKLDRYAYIESKLDSMEYLDSEALIESYYKALVTDAEKGDRNITASTNLRKMAYHMLKRVTNDFVEEIFEPEKVIHISTVEEFVAMLNENPTGNFVLDNDIDLSAITGADAVITTTFMGKLNGQGHVLYGTDLYVFNSAKHAYFVDVALSQTKRSSLVKNATLCETNDVVIDTRKLPIYTIEDFLAIQNKPDETYILMNDIDFSQYTATADVLVGGTFVGTLLGNGYTLRGLNGAALFQQFNGTVKDLNVENFTNIKANGDFVNAFARNTNAAKFYNLTFKNIVLSGRHRVAVVSGTDNANSVFENIKVLDSSVTGANGFYNAMLVGRKYGGSLKNIYVDGTLRVSATESGGIIGASHNAMTMINVVSKIDLIMDKNTDASGRKLNGGIIGNTYNAPVIKNTAFIGQVFGDTYSLTGSTAMTCFTNCFELAQNGGISAVNGENIKSVDVEALTVDYYKNTFDFGDDFWPYERMTAQSVSRTQFEFYRDFYVSYVNGQHKANESEAVAELIDGTKAVIAALAYDEAKTLAENKASVDAIIAPLQDELDVIALEEHRIYNANDFITKISADLAGTFHIMSDIDFSEITPTSTALITGTFTGKLYGNSHTLSNLTGAALFAQFNGTAAEMSIENFANVRAGTDFIAAFAKQTYGATITDIYFDNITLSGRHNVAVLSGMDGRENANSTFSRISITNANVSCSATGVYGSILVGRKYGGIISDIYVEGTLTVSATESGGVVGASQQNVTMRNIVSKVNLVMLANTDGSRRKLNGGIVGNTYNAPQIANTVFLGTVTGDTYSFTGSSALNYFTNCYELESTGGISAVNGTNILSVTRPELTKAFYVDELGFDENVWSFVRIAELGHPMLIHEEAIECTHEYEIESTEDATCIAEGKVSYICVKCGDEYAELIPIAEHQYVGETTDATCENEGYTVYTCSECGNHYTETIAALGHEFSEEWSFDVAPTCTAPGEKSHHCIRCEARDAVTSVDMIEHVYRTVVTAPTCTAKGYTTHICSNCGGSYVDSYTDALEHAYKTEKIDATCISDGYIISTCKKCQDSMTQSIDALGHNFSKEWTIDKEATCTQEGSMSHHCTRCNAKSDITKIEKPEHRFVGVEYAPTCTKDGYTLYTCTDCGATKKESVVKAPGHADDDNDGFCDVCNLDLTVPDAPFEFCSCGCHSRGIVNFFWKFVNFFHRIFGMDKYRYCACGDKHW